MIQPTQLNLTPRDLLFRAAIEEVLKFEEREREFRRQVKRQRAAELHMPLELAE